LLVPFIAQKLIPTVYLRINHNSGISKFTSRANDWVLKYVEVFETRALAAKREREIKSKKSRKYIEWLVEKSKDLI
jgi:predicted GIY-YIG superfamily endonuclease